MPRKHVCGKYLPFDGFEEEHSTSVFSCFQHNLFWDKSRCITTLFWSHEHFHSFCTLIKFISVFASLSVFFLSVPNWHYVCFIVYTLLHVLVYHQVGILLLVYHQVGILLLVYHQVGILPCIMYPAHVMT